MARMVNCVKLGKEAEGLDFPPVPGDLSASASGRTSPRKRGPGG
jgi:Fe-S cluster biosynthesis and repair protein YggX